jgi:hypothetical protein
MKKQIAFLLGIFLLNQTSTHASSFDTSNIIVSIGLAVSGTSALYSWHQYSVQKLHEKNKIAPITPLEQIRHTGLELMPTMQITCENPLIVHCEYDKYPDPDLLDKGIYKVNAYQTVTFDASDATTHGSETFKKFETALDQGTNRLASFYKNHSNCIPNSQKAFADNYISQIYKYQGSIAFSNNTMHNVYSKYKDAYNAFHYLVQLRLSASLKQSTTPISTRNNKYLYFGILNTAVTIGGAGYLAYRIAQSK